MWYNVDFYKLALNFQIVDLRRPKVMAWIYSFIKAISTTGYNWGRFRETSIYKLAHNGQVCRLRKALNDRFDQELRRIYINDSGNDASRTYIYTPAEEQTKYLGTIYLYESAVLVDSGYDFLVHVPGPIVAAQNYELRALIDFYKLGGKRYLIIEI